MSTPVAFVIFNRPDTTRRVFASIREQRPSRLLVIADGPRPGRAGEDALCREARSIVDQGVDWPCTVERCFSDTNLGCRRRLSSGFDWLFKQVEAAIVLEDDCLPHPTFFAYCTDLLDRWRDDERVMSVCGTNLGLPVRSDGASYGFTRTPHCWGWASWRRAWAHYDVAMRAWPGFRDAGRLEDVLRDGGLRRRYRKVFDRLHAGALDTWDWQWTFACWMNHGLCAVPRENLVSNIGFGASASHTTGASRLAALPTRALPSPIIHPQQLVVDEVFFAKAEVQSLPSLATRAANHIGRILR